MSDRLEQARDYHAAIREILLRDWDPIGVADVPEAQDEYDSYISQIYGLLIRREPLATLTHIRQPYRTKREYVHLLCHTSRDRTQTHQATYRPRTPPLEISSTYRSTTRGTKS